VELVDRVAHDLGDGPYLVDPAGDLPTKGERGIEIAFEIELEVPSSVPKVTAPSCCSYCSLRGVANTR
jgi:hypothetical protein